MRKSLLVFGVAVCVIGLSTGVAVIRGNTVQGIESGLQSSDTGSGGLAGTWIVSVTPPPGGPPPYLGIATFTDYGEVVTAPDPSFLPSTTSSGQGAWEKMGGHQFASTHILFVYGPGGNIVTTAKINSTYKMNGKSNFDGFGQLQICDPSFSNCFTVPGCASLRGTRVGVNPPPCQ